VTWQRFIAIGDSFTEGLEDRADNGRHHGWADRVAATMAAQNPELQYANLAVRGRILDEIVTDQLPRAIAMAPDLLSIGGGINDALRPRWDINRSKQVLESGVIAARSAGIDVVLFAFGDPSRRSKTLGVATHRLRAYRDAVHSVANEHGCYLVDFWDETVFDDRQFWADDRLHVNQLGHERVAAMVATTLGLGQFDWNRPLPAAPARTNLDVLLSDAKWTGQYVLPWIGRRLRGQSSGARIDPKRPQLETIEPDLALH
jgi:lysophospholipase L1-like esterase